LSKLLYFGGFLHLMCDIKMKLSLEV